MQGRKDMRLGDTGTWGGAGTRGRAQRLNKQTTQDFYAAFVNLRTIFGG